MTRFAAHLASLTALLCLAPTSVHAVSVVGPDRDGKKPINCKGPLEGGLTQLARTPRERPAVIRAAEVAWSKQVAAVCPDVDPSWLRARNQRLTCGYYSSSYRYTCKLIGTPEPKRR